MLAVTPILLPATGQGQSIRGTVVDADYGRVVRGARAFLLDSVPVVLDSAATDDGGRFALEASGPGAYFVHVEVEGYLSYSTTLRLDAADTVELRVEMPLISTAAARAMGDVVQREEAFQLPWEELCQEPVRPWEAGILVGVSRDRTSMEPVPRAVVRLETIGAVGPDRSRVATGTGSFWFCNVPAGRVRVIARADGFAPDTFDASIRAGTVSWYDALLRPER